MKKAEMLKMFEDANKALDKMKYITYPTMFRWKGKWWDLNKKNETMFLKDIKEQHDN